MGKPTVGPLLPKFSLNLDDGAVHSGGESMASPIKKCPGVRQLKSSAGTVAESVFD